MSPPNPPTPLPQPNGQDGGGPRRADSTSGELLRGADGGGSAPAFLLAPAVEVATYQMPQTATTIPAENSQTRPRARSLGPCKRPDPVHATTWALPFQPRDLQDTCVHHLKAPPHNREKATLTKISLYKADAGCRTRQFIVRAALKAGPRRQPALLQRRPIHTPVWETPFHA